VVEEVDIPAPAAVAPVVIESELDYRYLPVHTQSLLVVVDHRRVKEEIVL
jgi:hypothetical protein